MLPAIGTAAGGGLGGLLGQAGDALSAPRRALWSALGLPETGAEMVGTTFGLDPQSALARALGFGAEMVLDPLTLGGMVLGGPAANVLTNPWRRGAQLDQAIDGLQAARAAGVADIAAVNQAARSQMPAALAELNAIDLPGVAAGSVKNYRTVPPEVARAFEEARLGVGTQAGGLDVFGTRLPEGAALEPVYRRIGTKMRMGGRTVGVGPEGLPSLAPDELAWLSRQNPADDLAHPMAVNRLAGAMPPEPTLGQLLGPSSPLGPDLAGLPLRQGLNEIDAVLPVLGEQARRYRMTGPDAAMIGGAGLGAILGGYMGAR